MAGAKTAGGATTEEIAAGVNVTPATIRRWARLGVLPPAQVVSMGRRGTNVRWPLHAPEQARWVLSKLEAGHTFAEIAAMLAAGEFRPSSSGDGPDEPKSDE